MKHRRLQLNPTATECAACGGPGFMQRLPDMRLVCAACYANLTARSEYIISIDRPSKLLSPNRRDHWAKKYKAMKAARSAANILASAQWGTDAPRWKHARVVHHWVLPTRAYHPDPDNAEASLKPWFDGFTDWGIVENDRFLVPLWGGLTVEKTAEWPRGRVILTFREITAGMQEVPA